MTKNANHEVKISRRQVLAGMVGFSIFGAGGCRSLFGQQKIRLAVAGLQGQT